MPSCSRRQPTSRQCGTPAGAPLYPVARMRLSFTATAPTLRLVHVERPLTRYVMFIKYSGHGIRCIKHPPIYSGQCTGGRAKCQVVVLVPFAVMPRQAVLAALVVYRKSTLPPPLACLPCLTAKNPNTAGRSLLPCCRVRLRWRLWSSNPSRARCFLPYGIPRPARQSPCFSQNRGFAKGGAVLCALARCFHQRPPPRKNRPDVCPLAGK